MSDAYVDVAKKIIQDSIKSAIYIDDQAQEPFEPFQDSQEEHQITKNLYENFKNKGVSLSVYKYDTSKYDNDQNKNYIFQNRDLVLLDWKLEGESSSGEKALELLEEITCNQQHIPFCVIYTTVDTNIVLENIVSYFSGISEKEYKEINGSLSFCEEEDKQKIKDFIELSFDVDGTRAKEVFCKDNLELINNICKELKNTYEYNFKDKKCCLIDAGIAFSNLHKSTKAIHCSRKYFSKTFAKTFAIINNTIILILKKRDIKPEQLIDSFSKNITEYEKGVLQIISLEIQNVLRKKGSFIDENMFNVSKTALGYHKKTHPEDFESFIKNVFIEHEALRISNEELSILKKIDVANYNSNLREEYISLNAFYNSSHTEKIRKKLSFGDVFRCIIKNEQKYFMCITPLCDCAHPEKRKHCFFFVSGKKCCFVKALEVGETGFISYLSDSEEDIVQWGEGIKGEEPTYIVPEVYLVRDNEINEKKLKVISFISNSERENLITEGRNIEYYEYEFEYVTTIKPNYAQRIANHAFMHPIRVGVDFVTKREQPEKK